MTRFNMICCPFFASVGLFLALSLSACAGNFNIIKKIDHWGEQSLVVSKPITLARLQAVSHPKEQFDQNMFLGSVAFQQGYVINEQTKMVENKVTELMHQDRFTEAALAFYERALGDSLKAKEIIFRLIPAESLINVVQIHSERIRKLHEADGLDNINLPRISRLSAQIDLSQFKDILSQHNARYFLIPVVEYYYGHNGGWFNGQTYGCGRGVRMSFLLYAFDLRSGQLVFAFQHALRKVDEFKFKMGVNEIEQYLDLLEPEMTEVLADHILDID